MTKIHPVKSLQHRRWLCGVLLGALGALLLAPLANAAPAPELIAGGWDVSDETSSLSVDHSAWQELLDTYLMQHPSGINRFDYAALRASTEGGARLTGYLAHLQGLDPRAYSRAEQKPYWINFYNALTVKVVVDDYPVDSIKQIHGSLLPFPIGPWGDVHAEVTGIELTLDDIEHGILRPIWGGDRIHYAVNCASLGCPNLAPTVYSASNVEAQMEAAAREYVNHPRGVDFVDDDFLVVSSIYDWYVVDFKSSEQGVIEHLLRHAQPELAARLKAFSGAIDYAYDWNLNQP